MLLKDSEFCVLRLGSRAQGPSLAVSDLGLGFRVQGMGL